MSSVRRSGNRPGCRRGAYRLVQKIGEEFVRHQGEAHLRRFADGIDQAKLQSEIDDDIGEDNADRHILETHPFKMVQVPQWYKQLRSL